MRLVTGLICVLLLLSACSKGATSELYVAGSTSVQPMAEMLAEAYGRTGGSRISIQGGGSTAGVQAVLSGVAEIGAISRDLTAGEAARNLVAHVIGYDVLTVVVHPDNPLSGLTSGQLRSLFDGTLTDWRNLGGPPGRVHLVSREAGSGSREAFRTLVGPVSHRAIVQSSSGAIRVAVMQDPQAIGYVSLGVARMGGLRLLAVDGIEPGAPGYGLIRPLSFVTRGRPTGEAEAFIRFALSPAGQSIIRAEGMVPVNDGS